MTVEGVECPHCDRGSVLLRGKTRHEGTSLRCAYCGGTGRIQQPEDKAMTAEELLQEALTAIQERRDRPHGPSATDDDQKIAGQACVTICNDDRDKARTLWKVIVHELGYMPHSVCVALLHASSVNLVPDVEAPGPS